jgi:hypothetical protein
MLLSKTYSLNPELLLTISTFLFFVNATPIPSPNPSPNSAYEAWTYAFSQTYESFPSCMITVNLDTHKSVTKDYHGMYSPSLHINLHSNSRYLDMTVIFTSKDYNYQYNQPGFTNPVASPATVTPWNGRGGKATPTVTVDPIEGKTSYTLEVTYEHTNEYVQFSYGSKSWISNSATANMTDGYGTTDSGWMSNGDRNIVTYVDC